MSTTASLELWGGLECTVARIGGRYRDQSVETGHHARPEDLDRIAALGIRTLRYPVIWETISPDAPDRCDWSWHDDRLGRIRQLGLTPIAGLLHHGSGPHYTNLLDPAFPRLFAQHAGRVARRYPWIAHYTPVNEPLTTARFSGLYGHWYPHGTSYREFLTALVAQCRATVLAMRAIRRVNAAAQLVQTDDLGRTFSTPALAYQAEHENERRWLTFDLLCGRVDRHHPWWQILRAHGISERHLEIFLEADCAPDIIGINHYLTSERFLDERLARYPQHFWGGNGVARYADVEAVRLPRPGGELGPAARLAETWERYKRPIAVTEVHHGCTRDEQLRWLSQVWGAAKTARERGADIRAVTIWSMFGTTDWNSLLTREHGVYEPGVFDVRGPEPRPTALAHAAASLAVRGRIEHPVLDRPGWWRRDERFYRPVKARRRIAAANAPRSLLILGAGTAVANALSRIATIRGLDHEAVRSNAVGSAAPDKVLDRQLPWAVIDAETAAPQALVRRCHDRGVPYLAISSAQVFAARVGQAYAEDDVPSVGDRSGRRAASAQARIAALCPGALIVRAGPLFGPWDGDNFAWRMLHALASGGRPKADAEIVSPSYLPDLVHVALDLLIDGERGFWHLPNSGQASWAELAMMLAERAGLPPRPRVSATGSEMRISALRSRRGAL
ncbi:MAG TPA: sugar nucleotide-binding protein, partial [Enterovirga sp.]|nr:sugar nucleotide-binding protein [Enterovirga sp.]